MREINNPLTWVYCFLSFIAARTDCEATRNLVAYAQIVIQLTRKHGDSGWLVYDQHFRQQLAGGADLVWKYINNSLMSATVLAPSRMTHQALVARSADSARAMTIPSASVHYTPSMGPLHSHNTRLTQLVSSPGPPPSGDGSHCARNFSKGLCPREPSQCKYEHLCILCNRAGHGTKDCNDRPGGKGKGKAALSGPRAAIKGSADQGST